MSANAYGRARSFFRQEAAELQLSHRAKDVHLRARIQRANDLLATLMTLHDRERYRDMERQIKERLSTVVCDVVVGW